MMDQLAKTTPPESEKLKILINAALKMNSDILPKVREAAASEALLGGHCAKSRCGD